MRKIIFILNLFVFAALSVAAKDNLFTDKAKIKAYLEQDRFAIDTTAGAVYLATEGKVVASYSERKFYYDYKVQKMARIIREQGKDVAVVTIDLLPGQRLSDVTTKVYRLTGKTVSERENSEPIVVRDLERGQRAVLKFGNLKAGDIIYYSYTIKSYDLLLIPAWYMQEDYPNLHSELILSQETGLDFFIYSNTGRDYKVSTYEELDQCAACRFGDVGREIEGQFRTIIWARNNIPAGGALAGYAITQKDLLQVQLRFLQSQRHTASTSGRAGYMMTDERNGFIQDISLNSWENVNDLLLYGGSDFGGQLGLKNNEINVRSAALVQGAGSDAEKASRIFTFVRDSISLLNDKVFASHNNLETAFDARSGSLGEKNLLLVKMMRHAGLNAEPVVLCKGNDDDVRTDFVNFASLNYCLTQLTVGSDKIYLDPAAAMPFGQTLPDCAGKLGFIASKKGGFTLMPRTASKSRVVVNASLEPIDGGAAYESTVNINLPLPMAMQFRSSFLSSAKRKDDAALNQFAATYFRLNFDTLLSCSVRGFAAADSPLVFTYKGRVSGAQQGIDPYLFPVADQPFRDQGAGIFEVIYMLDMPLRSGYEIKPMPVARNLRFRDNHIAYNSNNSVGEGRFRLLYTLQYNKPLTEGVPDDLPVFINDIRKHQEQTIKVVKSGL
ncbi:DUF3857 domain-containing protein [Taibaiella helva]|uniref:DUF3857 domain-containing protein n=1 Tax=Taibaiella helva TaxID=2301235 RepID=UPI000E587848|nr:DUF3857 domain-containing protein [Taibaiella helva]